MGRTMKSLSSTPPHAAEPRARDTHRDEAAREALRLAAAALDQAELQGQPFKISHALATLAHAHRLVGALAEAETQLEAALRWARLAGSHDAVVDLLCEAADTAARLARRLDDESPSLAYAARERARDRAFEAGQLAARVADSGWELQVLLRISEVLDRCGDRADAMHWQARALSLVIRQPAPDPRVLTAPPRLADV